jgi:uncharacterized protein YbaR (Trm112 family)
MNSCSSCSLAAKHLRVYVSIGHVRELQERNRRSLATMLEINRFARLQSSQNPHQPFWMLTLSLGIAMTRAALEWGDSALNELSSMETQPCAFTKSRRQARRQRVLSFPGRSATSAHYTLHSKENRTMQDNLRTSRWSHFLAWAIACIFILGFFFPLVGAWTGPISGVWFVGTQKPRRGFAWMLAFSFIPSLLYHWRNFPLSGPVPAFRYLGLTLLVSVLGILPFTFHRLISPRLPGLLSTLPFPPAAVAFKVVISPPMHVPATPSTAIPLLLISWFAAVLIWKWNQEFRRSKLGEGPAFLTLVFALWAGYCSFRVFTGTAVPQIIPFDAAIGWGGLLGALVLAVLALCDSGKQKSWAERPPTVALLQSPATGDPLHVVTEKGREALLSISGERFPIRDGIPSFLTASDLTGDNGKYNHLYQVIGGFYDDSSGSSLLSKASIGMPTFAAT